MNSQLANFSKKKKINVFTQKSKILKTSFQLNTVKDLINSYFLGWGEGKYHTYSRNRMANSTESDA